MAAGDFALFAGGGRIFAGGSVTHTFRNARLAQRLWGLSDDGQTWELMFSLAAVRPFNITYKEMTAIVGYDQANIVQGFTVLDDDRSAAVFDQVGLDSDTYPPQVPRTDYVNLVERLGSEAERAVTAAQRLEQSYLRRLLFPARQADCALCGRVFPIEFLVAAHIKKRASCSHEEKLDAIHIVMAACKLGCDALYEAGLVSVDDPDAS